MTPPFVVGSVVERPKRGFRMPRERRIVASVGDPGGMRRRGWTPLRLHPGTQTLELDENLGRHRRVTRLESRLPAAQRSSHR